MQPTSHGPMNVTGFVQESLAAVRRTPAHPAEMVTQLLFGDLVRILEKTTGWYRVKSLDDGYEGWLSYDAVSPVSEAFLAPDHDMHFVAAPLATVYTIRNGQHSELYLPRGARFPVLGPQHEQDRYTFQLGETRFTTARAALMPPLPATPDAIALTARSYLNAPYLWGGKSPFGIDCSGFTQMLFRQHGIKLPRDSYQQVRHGTPVDFAQRQPGDLPFFVNARGQVSHVGYLLDANTIIHGAGRVRIDRFDAQGIFNAELDQYTHRFYQLRRVLS